MKKRYPEFQLTKGPEEDQLVWIGQLKLYGVVYEFHIEYPPIYPFVQPRFYVYRIENGIKSFETFSYTPHMYQNKSLCLFTWDNSVDSWQPYYTVLDTIDRFLDFIDLYKSGRLSPQHFSPDINVIPLFDSGIILPIDSIEGIQENSFGVMYGLKSSMPNIRFSIISQLVINNSTMKDLQVVYIQVDKYLTSLQNIYTFNVPVQINWIYVEHSMFQNINLCQTSDEINQILSKKFQKWQHYNFDNPLMFLTTIKNTTTNINVHEAICLQKLHPLSTELGKIQVTLGPWHKNYFKRLTSLVGEKVEFLDDYIIVFFGLGSLGGNIALEVAKCGFSEFILVDLDLLMPENLPRHELGSNFLYEFKVGGIAQLIQQRNPSARIKVINQNIFWPSVISEILKYSTDVKKKMVFVSTIAKLEEEYLINALSVFYNIPTIYASCSGGVQMGRIFRVIPNKTACYHCIGMMGKRDEYPAFPKNDESWLRAPYEEGLPGIGIDVSEIATNTSRMVLQTVLEDKQIKSWYPYAEGDHILIVLHQVDKLKPGKYIQKAERIDDCPVCGKKDINQNDITELTELFANLPSEGES